MNKDSSFRSISCREKAELKRLLDEYKSASANEQVFKKSVRAEMERMERECEAGREQIQAEEDQEHVCFYLN